MKKVLLGLALAAGTSTAMATPILSCKTSGAGGSLIKEIIVEKNVGGLEVKAAAYNDKDLKIVKILDQISTPVSFKIVLDANTGFKTSLVMNKKQAVMLYEPEQGSSTNGALVEFLTCK